MPARKCPKCDRPMKGDRCRACETAIAKPEHAEQAKVTPPSDHAAIREGEPKSKSISLEPLPTKHEPGPWLDRTFLGLSYLVYLIFCLGFGLACVTGVFLLIPPILYVRNAAVRTETTNHMKEIGLASHWYHDFYKELPPPNYVLNKDGKRIVVQTSWRVAVLPLMNQGHLHDQFDINVGWDHENNVPMQNRMPLVFTTPFHGDREPNRNTHFQYFTGQNTLFPSHDKGITFVKITDGTSNTFMFAEAHEAVLWTRPADMTIRIGQPLPLPENEFHAAFCDGTVRIVRRNTTTDTVIRQLIDPNDCEPKGNWE